jgi:hypothetical protein
MSKALPLILGLAAAGVVGALAATLVTKDHAVSADAAPPPDRADARLAEAIEKIDALARRVEVLEQTSLDRAVAAAEPPALTPEQLSEAAGAAAPVTEDELKEKVKEMVTEARNQEWEQMGQRFAARAAEREAGMVKRLGETAGLTTYQQEELTKLLGARREAMGNFFRTMFTPGEQTEPVDMRKLREDLETVRAETDEQIKALLSPDQYDAFTKEESSMRGPGFMRGMGGFGGGGGGGGGR